MEIEIGWRLMVAIIFVSVVVVAVFRIKYGDQSKGGNNGIR